MVTHILTDEVPDPPRMGVGDLVEVHLVENAGTGHLWRVTACPAFLRPLGEETLHTRHAAGASGLRVLTFEADAAGSAELALELRRPWEDAPLRTASWVVRVG